MNDVSFMLDNKPLIEAFQSYLETLENNEDSLNENDKQPIDLYSLFTELTALKTEVKSESRLVKSSFDEFKSVFDTLRSSQEQLQKELNHSQQALQALQAQRKTLLKPILIEWLDMRDRIVATIDSLNSFQPTGVDRLFANKSKSLIDSIQQGQSISLRRLDEQLANYDVHPISALGQPLDPECMRVVAVDSDSSLANGVVTCELRAGFTWEGDLLRNADVKVNKVENN